MYPDSKSRSQKLYDRALASLPGGNSRTTVFMQPYPIYAARGDFADRPIRDYRSAYMTEQEVMRQAIFNRGLLNRGVLAAGYGLMALSTPMTDADIDTVITAASDALEEVSASA